MPAPSAIRPAADMPRERPALPATREEALAMAASNNPNVISANFTELAARDNIYVVRGQLLPQISIVGDLNRTYSPSVTLNRARQDQASVVARLTMPLYEGGQIYSQTRQAEQTVGQRRSQVDDARRQAVQQATQSWETLKAARAAITSFARGGPCGANCACRYSARSAGRFTHRSRRVDLAATIIHDPVATGSAQHDTALAEFNLAAAEGRLIAPELRLPVSYTTWKSTTSRSRISGSALAAAEGIALQTMSRKGIGADPERGGPKSRAIDDCRNWRRWAARGPVRGPREPCRAIAVVRSNRSRAQGRDHPVKS